MSVDCAWQDVTRANSCNKLFQCSVQGFIIFGEISAKTCCSQPKNRINTAYHVNGLFNEKKEVLMYERGLCVARCDEIKFVQQVVLV